MLDEEKVLSRETNTKSQQEDEEQKEEGEEMGEQRAHALRDLALSRKKKKTKKQQHTAGASRFQVPSDEQ